MANLPAGVYYICTLHKHIRAFVFTRALYERFAYGAGSPDSRLGLVGLLLHDVQDHATGGGAALGSRVDGDGLFRCACVFLPMNVHPERGRETGR